MGLACAMAVCTMAFAGCDSTENGGENRVWVQEDLVFMDSANCPDQTCVKQGVIKDGTVPIVCLPHKVIVRIEGGESGLDAAN